MRSFLLVLTIGLTTSSALAAQSSRGRSTTGTPAPRIIPVSAPTEAQIAAAKQQGKVRVELDTTKGKIELELDGRAAPIAVANFLNLVKAGFYDGMPFHRVEPGFVIQAGDPALVKRPPVGYTIPDEKSPIKHVKGTIAMARLYRGGQLVPNSASTQFYITLADTPHLDRMGFTAFGKVLAGMGVVSKIAVGDKILKALLPGKPGRGGRR
jgi:peptidyl-prolyl cis-trans isomerase B (cyclophilin B)